MAFGVALASGSAVLAAAAAPPAVAEDMPMADYLGLLGRIAPAAENGAGAYVQAFWIRCGRHLATADLRRAVADGDGDPVLMAMIRASQLRDATTLALLGAQVACEWRVSQ